MPSITLASGLELLDPWQLLQPMRERDDWYASYDGAATFEDNALGMPEIFLSRAVLSLIKDTEAYALSPNALTFHPGCSDCLQDSGWKTRKTSN